MNDVDNQPELGLSIEVAGAAPGKPFPAEDYMKRYIETILEHGGLFNQEQAALMAGVSQQRISQLVKAGKLHPVTLTLHTPGGPMVIEETIPGNDLRAWMEAPKAKAGRPSRAARERELQAA